MYIDMLPFSSKGVCELPWGLGVGAGRFDGPALGRIGGIAKLPD
jgi:hypothetical protein